jgi:hypothetical protein
MTAQCLSPEMSQPNVEGSNRCETVLGDEDLGQPIGNSGALRLWPERLSAGCFLPSTVFIFPGKRHASS